jgi:hypothetical protein
MSPIDAIRQDLQTVKAILDQKALEKAAALQAPALVAHGETPAEQLGLF